MALVNTFKPGKTYRLYMYPGLNDSLMGTLTLAGPNPGNPVGLPRYNNYLALRSPEFRDALEKKKVRLITYQTLVEKRRLPVRKAGPATSSPGRFRLCQNFPNPFNAETRIVYELTGPSRIRLSVVDPAGREKAVLDRGVREGAYHFDDLVGVFRE